MSKFQFYKFTGGPLDKRLDEILGEERISQESQWTRAEGQPVSAKPITSGMLLPESHTRGFLVKDDTGVQRRYLYLNKYKIKQHGKFPVRHFFKCQHVQTYHGYLSANTEQVSIRCRRGDDTHQNCWHCGEQYCQGIAHQATLRVCTDCERIFFQQTHKHLRGRSIYAIILQMEQHEATRMKETGVQGYVLNWRDISTAYRNERGYRCEACKLDLSQASHRHLLHVHHRDYDKTNNRLENLQALCIECHAKVDEHHRQQFLASSYQRQIYEVQAIRLSLP